MLQIVSAILANVGMSVSARKVGYKLLKNIRQALPLNRRAVQFSAFMGSRMTRIERMSADFSYLNIDKDGSKNNKSAFIRLIRVIREPITVKKEFSDMIVVLELNSPALKRGNLAVVFYPQPKLLIIYQPK